VLVVIVAVVATLIVGYRRLGPAGLALFGMLALPALFAPLFYELLRNFSQIHVTKAYSNLPVAVGVVLGAALFTANVCAPARGTAPRAAAGTGELRAAGASEGTPESRT